MLQSTPALEPSIAETFLPDSVFVGCLPLVDAAWGAPGPEAAASDAVRWLDEGGGGDGDGCVYVTTGSRVALERWQVEVLARGLLATGMRVVWSLARPEWLPSECRDNPLLYTRPWLDQVGVLAHRDVRAVVSHCGWGGVTELIGAGRGVLALPLDADQAIGAGILVAHGCALVLPGCGGSGDNYHDTDTLTARAVTDGVVRVSSDPGFAAAARSLRDRLLEEPTGDPGRWPLLVSAELRSHVERSRRRPGADDDPDSEEEQ